MGQSRQTQSDKAQRRKHPHRSQHHSQGRTCSFRSLAAIEIVAHVCDEQGGELIKQIRTLQIRIEPGPNPIKRVRREKRRHR